MSWHTMVRIVGTCHGVPRDVVPCSAMLCRAMMRHALPCYACIMAHHGGNHCIHSGAPCCCTHAMAHHGAQCCTHTVAYYGVLWRAMVCYDVLCCIVVCHDARGVQWCAHACACVCVCRGMHVHTYMHVRACAQCWSLVKSNRT